MLQCQNSNQLSGLKIPPSITVAVLFSISHDYPTTLQTGLLEFLPSQGSFSFPHFLHSCWSSPLEESALSSPPIQILPILSPQNIFSVYQSMLMALLSVSPCPGTLVSISVFLDIYLIEAYLNQLPEADRKLIREKDMVFISLCHRVPISPEQSVLGIHCQTDC